MTWILLPPKTWYKSRTTPPIEEITEKQQADEVHDNKGEPESLYPEQGEPESL